MSETQVFDLDALGWETIQKAADDSNWMPNESMRLSILLAAAEIGAAL